MTKGLEALEELKGVDLVTYDDEGNVEDSIKLGEYVSEYIEPIEKELKALEIFKNELWFSFSGGFRVFVQDEMKLDEEKYDLLKEVLNDR